MEKSPVYLTGTARSASRRLILFTAIFLLVGSTACGPAAPSATPTPPPTATPAPTLRPADSPHSLQVGNLQRTYILHVPPGLDSSKSLPLVFVFHGSTQDGRGIQAGSGFNAVSNKNGFLLVYPDGVDHDWNYGIPQLDTHVDDLAFIRQVIADLGNIARIDPKRIYAVGISAGALFSYRLACEMSDSFAAIGAVAGTMLIDPCQPSQPVAVLHVHGAEDKIVPYEGITESVEAYGVAYDLTFPPVEQTIAAWVKLDGCNSTAQVELLLNGELTHTVYSGCQAGTGVELYLIKSMGHAWPNITSSASINSQVIWDFFAAHPKP